MPDVVIIKTEDTNVKLTVVKRIKLGLEVFHVCIDGRVLNQYLCEKHAITKFLQLKQKLGVK